jgi:iron complex outermembrane receptor protein
MVIERASRDCGIAATWQGLSSFDLSNRSTCAMKSAREARASRPQLRRRKFAAFLLAWAAGAGLAWAADEQDVSSLPLEKLLDLEVSTASRYGQKQSEAAATVTVVTAAEIRQYGYTTLSDVLRSLPGFYISNDRNYDSVGVRGFSRTGDYNNRVLLLVDGYRFNDGVYGNAPLGQDFPINLDLIDRIEVISGPGSAVYGNNAMLGVINVITRKGGDISGTKLSGRVGNYGTDELSAVYGKQTESGTGLLLSASKYHSNGADIYFPAYGGIARGLDYEDARKAFAKVSADRLTFEGTFGQRDKGVPTASFGQVFGQPGSFTRDTWWNTSIQYAAPLSEGLELSSRIYYGGYQYRGDYINPLNPPPSTLPVILNRDETLNKSMGGEVRLLVTSFSSHKLLVGGDYRDDPTLNQKNFDVAPYTLYLNDQHKNDTQGFFVQDDYALTERLLFNLGLRHDSSRLGGSANSPRAGIIYQVNPNVTTFKLLYGSAYRAPNAFEQFYSTPEHNVSLGRLSPETVRTYEMVAEHLPDPQTKLGISVFKYAMNNLITPTAQFINQPISLTNPIYYTNLSASVRGVELRGEQMLDGGARWRASYNYQVARDASTSTWLPNSPHNQVRLNYSTPLPGKDWSVGLETQYMSNRRTLNGLDAGSVWLVNATLIPTHLGKGLDASFSIRNLFNRSYLDPATLEYFNSMNQRLDFIPQANGRMLFAKLNYTF